MPQTLTRAVEDIDTLSSREIEKMLRCARGDEEEDENYKYRNCLYCRREIKIPKQLYQDLEIENKKLPQEKSSLLNSQHTGIFNGEGYNFFVGEHICHISCDVNDACVRED